MGLTAELVADDYGIRRQEMDQFAQRSQELAATAQTSGFSAREIMPVALPTGEVFDRDESVRVTSTLEGLAGLKPIFREGGSVTAGNLVRSMMALPLRW